MTHQIVLPGTRLQIWSSTIKNSSCEEIELAICTENSTLQLKQFPDLCPDDGYFVSYSISESNAYFKDHHLVNDKHMVSVETTDVLLATKHVDLRNNAYSKQECEATLDMCCSLANTTISPGSLINIVFPHTPTSRSIVQQLVILLSTAASSINCRSTTTEEECSTQATSIKNQYTAADLIDESDESELSEEPGRPTNKQQAYPALHCLVSQDTEHNENRPRRFVRRRDIGRGEPSADFNKVLDHTNKKAAAFWEKQFEESVLPDTATKPVYVSLPQTTNQRRQTPRHARLHDNASAWSSFATARGGQAGRILQRPYKPKTISLPFDRAEKVHVGTINTEVARPDTGGYLADTRRNYSKVAY